ncbi:MAG: hypothetical protein DRJ40_05005 [Thermoprotei archaeon]|nr:MAG: hypothetical protein DRJ40_04520 [Thermoprotei archaeon]RLE56758.1 MAG: hypothetical protein DRJ40_05005 [Thermoprotei archaeon]
MQVVPVLPLWNWRTARVPVLTTQLRRLRARSCGIFYPLSLDRAADVDTRAKVCTQIMTELRNVARDLDVTVVLHTEYMNPPWTSSEQCSKYINRIKALTEELCKLEYRVCIELHPGFVPLSAFKKALIELANQVQSLGDKVAIAIEPRTGAPTMRRPQVISTLTDLALLLKTVDTIPTKVIPVLDISQLVTALQIRYNLSEGEAIDLLKYELETLSELCQRSGVAEVHIHWHWRNRPIPPQIATKLVDVLKPYLKNFTTMYLVPEILGATADLLVTTLQRATTLLTK